ncbi:MAG: dephospho-CoA kinase [Flavobacteriales bacterium]
MNQKKIIGITGGIGSGKSLVSELFSSLGYPSYNSDKEAKRLYITPEIKKEVISIFGEETYSGNVLNKAVLASKAFSNKILLEKLNQLIHPAVGVHFQNWLEEQDSNLVFKEAAVLIESGAYKSCNVILTVSAPESLRIARVMARDGVSETEVKARMDKQLSDKEREYYADWVILNDETNSVIKQVMKINEALTHAST